MHAEGIKTKTKCTPRCWNAKSKKCRCSCAGENHGCKHTPNLFTGSEPSNKESIHPKYRTQALGMPSSADAPLNLRKCPPLEVGDMVKIADGAPMGGELAYVYDTYEDFDDKSERGVSLITQTGNDTGGWSREEQEQWLTFVAKTGIPYTFRNVIALAEDFRNGAFRHVFKS